MQGAVAHATVQHAVINMTVEHAVVAVLIFGLWRGSEVLAVHWPTDVVYRLFYGLV